MPDSDTIIDTARMRTAKTIDLLLGVRRINVSELARRMDQPRDKVRHYVSGRTPVDVGQLELIAQALDVPAAVLLMEPEVAAQWTLSGSAFASVTSLIPNSATARSLVPGGRRRYLASLVPLHSLPLASGQ